MAFCCRTAISSLRSASKVSDSELDFRSLQLRRMKESDSTEMLKLFLILRPILGDVVGIVSPQVVYPVRYSMPKPAICIYRLKAARRTVAGCSEAGPIRGAPAPPAG